MNDDNSEANDFNFGIHVIGVPGEQRPRIRDLHTCRLLADLFTDSGGKRRQNAENRTGKCATPLLSMGQT
jgi:hypothetical protein